MGVKSSSSKNTIRKSKDDCQDVSLLPRYKEFLQLPDAEIATFVQQHGIETVYLPVDGTRRTFLWHVSKSDNLSLEALKDENIFLERYSEFLIPTMINFLSKFYDLGIKTIIFLLMDKTAFSRGKTYLEKSARLGIQPFESDPRYLEFFKRYDVKVLFGGFNHLYKHYGLDFLLTVFKNVESLTRNYKRHELVFYTGLSPEEDYLLVGEVINEMRLANEDMTMNSIIKKIYKDNLKSIDFGIFYGFPRDKILPPLLWGDSKRFYSKNPSLTLTKNQIKTAIYYTIFSRFLIKDEYHDHVGSGLLKQNKNSDNRFFPSINPNYMLLGPELYEFSTRNG